MKVERNTKQNVSFVLLSSPFCHALRLLIVLSHRLLPFRPDINILRFVQFLAKNILRFVRFSAKNILRFVKFSLLLQINS